MKQLNRPLGLADDNHWAKQMTCNGPRPSLQYFVFNFHV